MSTIELNEFIKNQERKCFVMLPDGNPAKERYFKEKTCCICGRKYIGFGNNPDPVKKTDLNDYIHGFCCDECNCNRVLPARMGIVQAVKRKGENEA